MIEIMAEHLLKDFGNISFQKQPQTYSQESSLRLLRVLRVEHLQLRLRRLVRRIRLQLPRLTCGACARQAANGIANLPERGEIGKRYDAAALGRRALTRGLPGRGD